MWARTLCPLLSSTRNMAFGSASTTVPSISITPSFFGMSSALVRGGVHLPSTREPPRPGDRVDLMRLVPRPTRGSTRDPRGARGVTGQPLGATEQAHVGPTSQSSELAEQPLIHAES